MEIVFKKRWTKGDVYRALTVNFVILAIIFGFLYYLKKPPEEVLSPVLPDRPPKFLYNIYGPLGNGFKKPMAVTVANERIYVSDTFKGRIVVFDYNGKYLFAFGKPGYGKTDFLFPYGIAGDSLGHLYVADMKKGAVMVFDDKGRFLRYFGEQKPEDKVIINPAGLFLQGDKVYITDLGRDAVLVFNSHGDFLQKIGKPGRGPGELRAPNAVIVKGKEIFVADSVNDRVAVFDEKGKFLRHIGVGANGKSIFINPRGLAFHGDTLLVVNNIPSHVHAFGKDGKELYSFGQIGQEEGNFGFPNGLFIDDKGRVYVTDTTNARIVVLQY